MASISFIQELNTVLNILGLVGIIAGIYVYFRFRVTSETIKLYQANQAAFEARITELERQHTENQVQIARLTSELNIVKALPLNEISVNLGKMVETQNTILTTQSAILSHLANFPASPVTVNAGNLAAA